jgi:cleavage and polyadenylation specificity factor subunit 2
VLASLASLGAGPARALLARFAPDPRCVLLLTQPGAPGSLARALADAAALPPPARPPLPLQLGRRVALQGDELAAWRDAQRKEAEARAEAEAAAAGGAEAAAAPQPADAEEAAGAAADAAPGGAVPMDLVVASEVDAEAAALCDARRPCLADGFAVPRGAAAPLFPFEARRAEESDYGQLIDARDFADGAAVLGYASARFGDEEAGSGTAQTRLALPAPPGAEGGEPPPTKVLVQRVTLQLACAIVVVDCSGRADGRSLRNTLVAMAPRRVVLVHGDAEATRALAEHAAGALPGLAAPVGAPRPGECCELSAATPSLRVRLSDDAADAAAAALAPAGDGTYAVAWLDGRLGPAAAAAAGGSGAPGGLRVLDAPPPGAPPRPHAAAFVGDARFSDLLQACAAAGIPAEFSAGGVLLCGRGVSVRRPEGAPDDADLLLEGALGEDYFRVRDVLYAQYRVI